MREDTLSSLYFTVTGFKLNLKGATNPTGRSNQRKITSIIAANFVSPPPLKTPAIIGLVKAWNNM